MKHAVTILALFTAAWLTPATLLGQADPTPPVASGPEAAVSYTELTDEGPYPEDEGRALGNGGLRVAVDINSRLQVKIDNALLEQALAVHRPEAREDPRTGQLLERLNALREATEALEKLPAAYQEEVRLYNRAIEARAEAGGTEAETVAEAEDAALAAVGVRARLALSILDPLLAALTARFEQRMERTEAEARADQALDAIFLDKPPDMLYNLDRLGAFLETEIELLERDVAERLEALGGETLAVELRGHILRTDGATPIPVPGHNEVQEGVEQTFQKIDFALSPQEEALLQQYEALAEQIGQARAEGQDLMTAVRNAFEAQEIPILEALEAAETAVEEGGDSLDALVAWADGDRLRTWLAGPAQEAVEGELASSEAWTEFRAILEEVETDVEILESLGRLASSLEDSLGSGLTPDAFNRILFTISLFGPGSPVRRPLTPEVWRGRLEQVRALVEGIDGEALLAPLAEIEGPIQTWNQTVEVLEAVREAVEPILEGARQALAALQGAAAARVAANLPEPAGQKRRPLTQRLDTTIDLRRIPGRREVGDEIHLRYTFFAGNEELQSVGWTDELVLLSFGWQGRAMASIALVNFKQGDEDDRWEPTAPVSYMLHRRAWPDEGASGLKGSRRGPIFTFGFSTMTLDFTDEESVEMGLAATLGFFDNFVLVGYGVNLQATQDEDFVFFSLRPFSLGNLFSPARGP